MVLLSVTGRFAHGYKRFHEKVCSSFSLYITFQLSMSRTGSERDHCPVARRPSR